jgi:hypothetical protein
MRPQELGDLSDSTSVEALYQQFYVDEGRLQQRIETMLEDRPACTLAELLASYPAEKGIAELIAYLAIASRDQRHLIDRDTAEAIVLPAHGTFAEREIAMPRVIFRSSYAP